MSVPQPKLDGVAKLFRYIIVGSVTIMILPHVLQFLISTLNVLHEPLPLPVSSNYVRLFVWAVVAGLLIGIAIRLARRV